MSVLISHWLGNWRYLVEKPVSAEGVESTVEKGSVPAFAFFFMLASSGVIATFGLLANSAAVIIGAMIVAPLMDPIISIRDKISERVEIPVNLEFSIIPETILRSSEKDNVDG